MSAWIGYDVTVLPQCDHKSHAIHIEQQYQAQLNALSPAERVARASAMLQWVRQMLARQITAEMGGMSEID